MREKIKKRDRYQI